MNQVCASDWAQGSNPVCWKQTAAAQSDRCSCMMTASRHHLSRTNSNEMLRSGSKYLMTFSILVEIESLMTLSFFYFYFFLFV